MEAAPLPVPSISQGVATAAFLDIPTTAYGRSNPMESLDCLPADISFLVPPQSSPMPDYSDLSYAASQMQVLLSFAPSPLPCALLPFAPFPD
jgi:hypothetical protein